MSLPTGVTRIQIFVSFDGPEAAQTFTMSDFYGGYEEEAYETLKDAAYEWAEKVMNDDSSYSNPSFWVTFETRTSDYLPYPPSTT